MILNLIVIVNVITTCFAYACNTPQGRSGTCVSIKLCPSLERIIQQSNRRQEDTIFLKNSHCGWDAFNNVKVCCEQSQISNIPEAPDIKNHRNYYLLNNFECGLVKSKSSGGLSYVAGGVFSDPDDFRWMALLGYIHGRGHLKWDCGGTVINSRYILTAAHCVPNLSSGRRLAVVRIGEHNLNKVVDCSTPLTCNPLYQDILIEQAIAHAEYNATTLLNDIALIRLRKEISSELRRPICLPFNSTGAIPNNLTVAGWGFYDNRQQQSPVLQYAVMWLYPHERCVSLYQSQRNRWPIWHKQICAAGKMGVNTCQGDSGGPLQAKQLHNGQLQYVQYGVISLSGEQCGYNTGFPSVSTRVHSYLHWILDNITE